MNTTEPTLGRYEIMINRDVLIDRCLTLMDADIRARVVVEIDPVTQRREMTVYTDDGHGNGVRLLGIAFEPGEPQP
jgi:hypothetical protein